MKRETKKVKKPAKRVRKPVAKPVEEEVTFIFNGPIVQQPKVEVKFPEVWNEELARAAKVLGGDPLEVITKLMAFLPTHYPNHLRMLEAIIEHERKFGSAVVEKPFREAAIAAHRAGQEATFDHVDRMSRIASEVQARREIIEPSVCSSKPPF